MLRVLVFTLFTLLLFSCASPEKLIQERAYGPAVEHLVNIDNGDVPISADDAMVLDDALNFRDLL